MIYGYVRVSTATQKIDRQLDKLREFGILDNYIYTDKQSGKDFNRKEYKKMIRKLKSHDLLVIKSIDRLGRDYNMIIDEWAHITKNIKADILVLDMPLLDTRQKESNLIGKFISDIVLQVLSFVAENERATIRQRQFEGIRLAKLKGTHMGRPRLKLPINFEEIAKKYLNREISSLMACEILSMSKGTFFRNIKLYRKE